MIYPGKSVPPSDTVTSFEHADRTEGGSGAQTAGNGKIEFGSYDPVSRDRSGKNGVDPVGTDQGRSGGKSSRYQSTQKGVVHRWQDAAGSNVGVLSQVVTSPPSDPNKTTIKDGNVFEHTEKRSFVIRPTTPEVKEADFKLFVNAKLPAARFPLVYFGANRITLTTPSRFLPLLCALCSPGDKKEIPDFYRRRARNW